MKTTIKTITIGLAMATFSGFADGVYFISGYDFRHPNIIYTYLTTNDNQQVELTPYSVRLLSVINPNSSYGIGEWSVKTEGNEFVYDHLANIMQKATDNTFDPGKPVGNAGATNGWPTVYTYSKAGSKKVKVYDEKGNIYNLTFSNPFLKTLSVDFSKFRSANSYANNQRIYIRNCPMLESIYIKMPTNAVNLELTDLSNLPSLKSFKMENAYAFNRIRGYVLADTQITNDIVFASCTNIGASAFYTCTNVQYAAFPKARRIEQKVFNCSRGSGVSTKLERLQIGDCLEFVGQNTFYKARNLTTIEFVTDEEDWIAAWNNHPVLPNWLGPASPSDVEGEATLTPITERQEQYYSNNDYPKPTKLVLVRRSTVQQ